MTELSPWQALLAQLDGQRPTSLLCCSQTDQPALQDWCKHHHCQLTHIDSFQQLENLGRFDCVIIADWLEHLTGSSSTAPAPMGVQLLARLRNLHSHAIWLLIPGVAPQPKPELIALGFQRLHAFAGKNLECYGYNLDRYNHKREWNTPRFWANPENWGKYWW